MLFKMALVAFGAIFFVIYPLGLVWLSGWCGTAGEGKYYLQMICGVYAVLGAYPIAAARTASEQPNLVRHLVERRGCRHRSGAVPTMTTTTEVTFQIGARIATGCRRAVVSFASDTTEVGHGKATASQPIMALLQGR
jgi:hypothetical protein